MITSLLFVKISTALLKSMEKQTTTRCYHLTQTPLWQRSKVRSALLSILSALEFS